MLKQMKVRGIAAILLLCSISLTACSTATTSSEPGNAVSSKGDSDKLVIGFSMDTLQEERWQRDRDLFVAAAEKLGAEVNVQVANGDDAKQIAQSENLISQGIDVLVVAPHNAEAAAVIVEMAHKAGIKVLSYDRLILNADVDVYISFDNEKVGEMQVQAVVAKAPKGNYALIEGADTDNNAHMFKQGQMNILKPLVEKGDITIIYDQWTKEWSPANALANMENALTATDNKIDAVVAANDGTAGGAIQALAAQGLAGKIPVSGQDAELAACQRVVEGTQTMTVYKPIKKIASEAAQIAVKMANGESVETNKVVNNNKIDVKSVLLEPIAVTKDNMDSTIIADGYHKKEDVYKNAAQ